MEMNMFEKMQQLPFLQGLSINDINDILTYIKLDFNTFEENDIIVHQGEQCNRLIYIIDGEYDVEFSNGQQLFILNESCTKCPHAIEPYNLFSVRRKFDRTYSFRTKGATFTISKDILTTRLLDNKIIRSNFINYLSNQTCKSRQRCQFNFPSDIEQKIASFIRSYCFIEGGEKMLRIKMDTLAELIDETRLNVSVILNKWGASGLIEIKRQKIFIPDIDRLP